MQTVNTFLAETKVVVFEPGNSTRYYLLLTKTSDNNVAITDMNSHRVTEVSFNHPDVFEYKYALQKSGYSSGDAEPMAIYLVNAIKETAYITFRNSDFERETKWFRDTQDQWTEHLTSIREEGGQIIDKGVIW